MKQADLSPSRQAGNRVIVDHAKSHMQTFFDEIKNGTGTYRTVASLGAQVAQEYRGRCVLELLQNAHDALAEAGPEDPRRISFVLHTNPDVLLVGNTGRPFHRDDFKGICQLAQSPKDPNKSVGNKGLGFRSVLEVSTRPEIWSTTPADSDMCFSFRFDPNVIDRVKVAAHHLEHRGLVSSPFDADSPLVDWSPEQLRQFRQSVAERRIDVVAEAMALSPYQLPLPVEAPPPDVQRLIDDMGCATVIRLPLDDGPMLAGEDAVRSITRQLDDLRAGRSVVFLDHLVELVIEVEGDRHRLRRTVASDTRLAGHPHVRQRELRVQSEGTSHDNADLHTFRVWNRVVGGDDDPEDAVRIRDAVAHLPNRWTDVRQATVGVAVEDTTQPVEGVFVIFLPTEQVTGTGAHINAPFYGSLDRSKVDFREPYNELVLHAALDLCLDLVAGLVGGSWHWCARAVIDIVASVAPVGGETWQLMSKLSERAEDRASPLDDRALILCDSGWRTPQDARLMPNIDDDDPIGIGRWREQAQFAVVSEALDGRSAGVSYLLQEFGGSVEPDAQEWINTVEEVARQVKGKSDVTWNDFLRSLLEVLPDELRAEPKPVLADPLAKARFLPTADGHLIAASGPTKLFFRPVQGIDELAGFPEDLPQHLEGRLAFLHPDVQVHEAPARRNTEVQKFLDGRFVKTYRSEDLLRDIVIPELPSAPTRHGSQEAVHCAETLAWTFRLVDGDPPESLLPLLRQLLVCCHDGWLPVSEATFGAGWSSSRLGDDMHALATGLPPAAAARLKKTMLLPPVSKQWLVSVDDMGAFFTRIGVVDGLRLDVAEDVAFSMSAFNNCLPQKPPSDTPIEAWADWCDSVSETMRPHFRRSHEYRLSGIQLLPEIHHTAALDSSGRHALSNLLLSSIDKWSVGWESVTVRKVGGKSWEATAMSPLKHWLRTLPWLRDRDDPDGESIGEEHSDTKPLSQRWLVPMSLLGGPSGRYAHLDPLTLDLAKRLELEPKLKRQLTMLGMNVYPTEDDKTGPELLDALARSWEGDRIRDAWFDVFLGQVRDAWRHFDADNGLPKGFLVRTGRRSFSVRTHGEMADVFLPDSQDRSRALRDHGKYILEMGPADANRLAETLVEATGISLASRLEERHTIDGAPWNSGAAKMVELAASAYEWLPVVLLSIAAHGGANPRGATTGAWREAAERLRNTRVVQCQEIVAKVVHNNDVIAESQPPSQWLPDDKVLVIRSDLHSHEGLAFAGQAVLNRQDISKDLRLVLGSLPKGVVERRDIEAALEKAEIDAQEIANVRQLWVGNLSAVVARVRPVLRLLRISEHGLEAAAKDADHLTEWLSSNLRDWDAPKLLAAARRSPDDYAMGVAAWGALGEVAQLPDWNRALAKLGGKYGVVENHKAAEQTTAHIEEATPQLRAFARHVAMAEGDPTLFHSVEEVHRTVEPSPNWSREWWDVPFAVVVSSLTARYKRIPAVTGHVQLIEGADTAEGLRDRLGERGILVAPDPYETADGNRRRLDQLLSHLRDIYRAWIDGGGSKDEEDELKELPFEFDGSEYLCDWTDAKLLEKALQAINSVEFHDACDGCSTLDGICRQLDLTPQSIEEQTEERLHRNREDERKKRTHAVAGQDVEVGATGYRRQLFEHLRRLATPDGPRASQDELTGLEKVPKRDGGGGGSGGVSPPRPSAELVELVGEVGEIWAYLWLRSEFGEKVVTRESWVSEIRRRVLPPLEDEPNDISDGHGFDVQFTYRRRKWHVEVKATIGDDSSFDLGVSEIKKAIQLARAGRWRILRVRNALSKRPEFDWLPNPFEEEHKGHFHLHQGGMRVSYRVNKKAG